jgi:hypothetical protein
MIIDRQKLHDDIRLSADIVGAPFSNPFIERILTAFDDVLDDTFMGMRATTHAAADRKLNWRICYRQDVHPLRRARDVGLFPAQPHAAEPLIDALTERFPNAWGFDVDAAGSLDKVWIFLPGTATIDDLLAVPGFPATARAAKRLIRRACVVAFDLANATINLYAPVFEQGTLTPEAMRTLVADLGFPAPTDGDLALSPHAFSFYQTCAAHSQHPLRLSIAVRCIADDVPQGLHPVLDRFAEQAPFASAFRQFLFYPAYSARGKYYKIASDYQGNHADIVKPLGDPDLLR